jgi:hypothetical protein
MAEFGQSSIEFQGLSPRHAVPEPNSVRRAARVRPL